MQTPLVGLYAGNPLAAMAAYGLLLHTPDLRMRWINDTAYVNCSKEAIAAAALSAVLSPCGLDTVIELEYDQDVGDNWVVAQRDRYRAALLQAIETGADDLVEWLQGWGCEIYWASAWRWQRSALLLPSGPQKYAKLVGDARTILEQRPERMHASLFAPWDRGDAIHNTLLDPGAFRSHAQASKLPSDLSNAGMAGAFMLAMLAHPYFPCRQRGDHAIPLTWTYSDAGSAHNWITWDDWLDADQARYLIQHPGICAASPAWLRYVGISRVWRAAHLWVRQSTYRFDTACFVS